MEKRNSTRVRVFGIDEVQNRSALGEVALHGLIVDISSEGIQVLTDRTFPFNTDLCRITVSLKDGDTADFLVNQRWSKDEGTLYIRYGFAFDARNSRATESAQKVLEAYQQGTRWLHCSISEASSKI
jgi:hypothetical protein